jgi:hypothetical protein
LLRPVLLIFASLLTMPAAFAQAPQTTTPAQPGDAACPAAQQPSGVDLGKQIQSTNPALTKLAVTPVADFDGLWKAITDAFGQPPPSIVPDVTVIKSLQIVWFIDPGDPLGVVNADIYAFDAQNCYVVDIGLDSTKFSIIAPFATMPSLGAKP